jgi:glycosyltransferase involved in cell wall biosynthesis
MMDPELIDVIMCTWNSNKSCFSKCLLSIKREVGVHHFIVIDRYSSDGTLRAVRSVFPGAKIYQTNANLANARRIGITHVDTRYFAFIDDDIEVSEGWFSELISLIKSGKQIGAIQGSMKYYVDYLEKASVRAQKFELSLGKGHTKQITNRGLTNNTVLVAEIVRDFNPPGIIHSWEDFLLTQHVIKKGYRWLETDKAQVTNYGDFASSYLSELWRFFQRGKWHGAGDRLVHRHSSSFVRSVSNILLSSSKSILYSLIISILISDPRALLLRISGQLGYLKGFFSADKNIVPYELHHARNTFAAFD